MPFQLCCEIRNFASRNVILAILPKDKSVSNEIPLDVRRKTLTVVAYYTIQTFGHLLNVHAIQNQIHLKRFRLENKNSTYTRTIILLRNHFLRMYRSQYTHTAKIFTQFYSRVFDKNSVKATFLPFLTTY